MTIAHAQNCNAKRGGECNCDGDTLAALPKPKGDGLQFMEQDCPGHVASDDPKICRLCGTHIDSLR